MNSFEELVQTALSRCTTDNQKAWVNEEKNLIERRGWEKYIVLCTKIVAGIKSDARLDRLMMSKSALDSIILHINVFGSPDSFIQDKKKKDVFFNDALRLTLSFHQLDKSRISATKLNSLIEDNMRSEGLFFKETLRSARNEFRCGSPEAMENLIVVSNDPVSQEDFEIAMKLGQSEIQGEEEKTILKYLILKVQMFGGL